MYPGSEHYEEVRFGSLADISHCTPHVRFTPKADICSAIVHVRFGARSGHLVSYNAAHSVTSRERSNQRRTAREQCRHWDRANLRGARLSEFLSDCTVNGVMPSAAY